MWRIKCHIICPYLVYFYWRRESAEQIAKEALEVIGGNEPHSELGETSEESHSEEDESAEQHANELP
jgi:hypothetical protein